MKPWTPHAYQLEGVKWLISRPGAGLLADMGLGKTAMTLAAIKVLKNQGMAKKVLIIAPIRTLYTVWPNEIKKWTDFSDLTILNCHEDRERFKESADIYCINPESALPLLSNGFLFKQGFDLLIIDESSQWKNPTSRRFKALKKGVHAFPRRWILTGTPAPNGLVDMWSQIYILDFGESLGKFITHFYNAFCVPDWSGFSYYVPAQAANEMFTRIAPLCLRIAATDHLDMPDMIKNEVLVTLPPEAMALYKEMQNELLITLEEEDIYSPNAAVAGMRCRQIANGGIYKPDGATAEIHTAKAKALKEVVEELQGNPLLVLYEFKHDLKRIQEVLGEVPNLSGTAKVDSLINKFNAGEIPVLLGHPASMGMGLNLQGACHNVCWFGPPWDLGLYDQANARVYRQGQESNRVVIHHLVAQDTLDTKVLEALIGKRKIQDTLLDSIKELNQSKVSL